MTARSPRSPRSPRSSRSDRSRATAATITAADVRSAALSLPDTTEKLAWGQPTFRVAGKIFASLGDDDTAMGVKCPKEDRAELIATEPEKFLLKEGHDDNYAWLRVRLAALEDAGELAAILADAWRQVAPRRLLAAHPELEAPEEG
ncbi:MmcQ/YjbR family DNA-binding protein [Streptomyces cyaneofuscatus]|uniref:MmcQ/YjbR family DNA-binding protein n=1 Tax=Streptomyces cyaneofuscatus TaxID=66883 RepID=UPI00362E5F99